MQSIGTEISDEMLYLLAAGILALVVFSTVSLQTIYRKLGTGGWKAWIPFLNHWSFFTSSGMGGAWMFTAAVPVLGAVAIYMAVYKISHRLGSNGTGMVLLAMFFPLLWLFVMAASRNRGSDEIAAMYMPKQSPVSGIQNGREWALAGSQPPQAPIPVSREMTFGYGGANYESPGYAMPPSQYPQR